MKSIKSAIFILANLTATAALEEAIGMVRPKALMTWSTSLTVFCRHSRLKTQYTLVLLSYLL